MSEDAQPGGSQQANGQSTGAGNPQSYVHLTHHESIQLWIAEYHALRDETLTRIRIQHEITIAALVAPGTVLGIGIQLRNPLLVLLYPFFGMLLCSSWAHHDIRKRLIGRYILDHIEKEPKAGNTNIGWEHSLTDAHDYPSFLYRAGAGVFLGTEFLALIAGLVNSGILSWIPLVLTALVTGAPMPPVLYHLLDWQWLILHFVERLWLVSLIVLALISIIITSIILGLVSQRLTQVRNLQKEVLQQKKMPPQQSKEAVAIAVGVSSHSREDLAERS